MYPQLAVLGLLMVLWRQSVPAQSPSGNSSASYVCNLARVKDHIGLGDYAAVRSGPGAQFRKTDRLLSGREVYVCDEHGEWLKVFYSGPNRPCGPTFSNGLDVQKTKGCRSGWIEKKWIDVISG
jgi:hypothetical protein